MINLVDISYFLDRANTDSSFPERMKTYIQLQRDLIEKDVILETLQSFRLEGLTPKIVQSVSEPQRLEAFLHRHGIKHLDYKSKYDSLLDDRLRKDMIVLSK